MGKGAGPNPTGRVKSGAKQSSLEAQRNGPLIICIAGANVSDYLLLPATIDAMVVENAQPIEHELRHLFLDKGNITK